MRLSAPQQSEKKTPNFSLSNSISISPSTTRLRMSQSNRQLLVDIVVSSPAGLSTTQDLPTTPRRKGSGTSHNSLIGWSSSVRKSITLEEAARLDDLMLRSPTSLSSPAIIDTTTLFQSDLSSPGLFRTPRKRKTNIMSSIIDLCNTIMGTGIVSLPYAFSAMGLGLGTIFVIISVWVTWFSLRLLGLSF
jgi:hypothetical protein